MNSWESCGTIVALLGTDPYWIMTCQWCEMHTTRTHCFGCGTSLFRNGLLLTYHKTLADQFTNIFCPTWGKYFERDTQDDELFWDPLFGVSDKCLANETR
jgi:hypothetical protein